MARAKRIPNKANGNGGRRVTASARTRISVTSDDHQQFVALLQKEGIAKRYGPIFPLAYGIARLTNRVCAVGLSSDKITSLLMEFEHSARVRRNGHLYDIRLTISMQERRNLTGMLQKEQNRKQYGLFRGPAYWLKRLANKVEAIDLSASEIEVFLYSISN